MLTFLNEKKENFILLIIGYVRGLNKTEYPREIIAFENIKKKLS